MFIKKNVDKDFLNFLVSNSEIELYVAKLVLKFQIFFWKINILNELI